MPLADVPYGVGEKESAEHLGKRLARRELQDAKDLLEKTLHKLCRCMRPIRLQRGI